MPSCNTKTRYSSNKMAQDYADSYNRDPLVKEILATYWCELHQGWHLTRDKPRNIGWFRRIQELIDKVSGHTES